MNIIRVDVDTQVGFAAPAGNLYVPTDDSVMANIRSLVADATKQGLPLIGSVDSHSYDAWEFAENGGPFPAHCVKGTADWLKMQGTLPPRFRFIPMTVANSVLVGENKLGDGNRHYNSRQFSAEAQAGVGLYFEKEVYSAFSNPNAAIFIAHLVEDLGLEANVTFQVFGYCTGMTPEGNFFCVGSFAADLAKQGYKVQIIADATAPLGDEASFKASIKKLQDLGVEWVEGMECLNH